MNFKKKAGQKSKKKSNKNIGRKKSHSTLLPDEDECDGRPPPAEGEETAVQVWDSAGCRGFKRAAQPAKRPFFLIHEADGGLIQREKQPSVLSERDSCYRSRSEGLKDDLVPFSGNLLAHLESKKVKVRPECLSVFGLRRLRRFFFPPAGRLF